MFLQTIVSIIMTKKWLSSASNLFLKLHPFMPCTIYRNVINYWHLDTGTWYLPWFVGPMLELFLTISQFPSVLEISREDFNWAFCCSISWLALIPINFEFFPLQLFWELLVVQIACREAANWGMRSDPILSLVSTLHSDSEVTILDDMLDRTRHPVLRHQNATAL